MENLNSEAREFWQEKEAHYGGTLEYRSFCRFLGGTAEGASELSGLLFLVNGKLIFEDFEREDGIFGFLIRRKKSAYKKTVMEMPVSDIRGLRQISQGTAQSRIAGLAGPSRPMSAAARFFSVVIHELEMADGNSLFFEIMDKSSLKDALKL